MRQSRLSLFSLVFGVSFITLIAGIGMGMLAEQSILQSAFGGSNILSANGSGGTLTDPEHQVNLSLLWSVWKLLQQKYIAPQEMNTQSLVYGAVAGMVHGIGDPYTVFMPPSENADFKSTLNGKLEGIGAELSMNGDAVTVVAPLKNSPAEKAGLLAGDVIAQVDGKSIAGMTLDQVVTKIRGQKGTTVALQIYRASKPAPFVLTITRDQVIVPTVESKIVSATGGQIGYVALNQFGDNSTPEMAAALKQFQGKALSGIILDLRYNGGGYLDGAVDIASMFLKSGEVVSVENRGGQIERHDVNGHPLFPDTPLVVLINQASASASEIVAGALQDQKRATIVGQKSFGKGTVQEVIDLPDGSSLRVTIARWLTPNGKNLGKEGVMPDIRVEQASDDVIGKKDTQLKAAEDWLLYKKNEANVSSSGTGASVGGVH